MLVDPRNYGNEAIHWKVDVPGRRAWFLDHVGQDQVDRFADLQQTLAVVAREQFDEVVLDGGQDIVCVGGTNHSARKCPVRLSASVQTWWRLAGYGDRVSFSINPVNSASCCFWISSNSTHWRSRN